MGMAFIITALVFLTFSIDVHAQTGWDYLAETPERIIGLLDLPDVVAGGCGPAPKRSTAAVFNQPSENGPAKTPCGSIYEGVTDVTGWIPAYRPNGTPTMWFASRGC